MSISIMHGIMRLEVVQGDLGIRDKLVCETVSRGQFSVNVESSESTLKMLFPKSHLIRYSYGWEYGVCVWYDLDGRKQDEVMDWLSKFYLRTDFNREATLAAVSFYEQMQQDAAIVAAEQEIKTNG